VQDIPDVVKRLRATFASGRTRTAEWRREQLGRAETMLREREDEFVTALHRDLGKAPTEAYTTEIGFVLAELQHARRNLHRWMRPERVWTPLVVQPGRARVHREPVW
jgi:aldehyde dehydrogenase (NAD+)